MKWILPILILPGLAWGQLSLEVVYPAEGQSVDAVDSLFIFGSVNPPTASVEVNDLPVRVYPNGAFLGMVPVQPGAFVFNCRAVGASDTVALRRGVRIASSFLTLLQDTIAIDTSALLPAHDVHLQPGDYLEVRMRATPGLHATFGVEGLAEAVAMVELRPQGAFYWGEAVFGDVRRSRGVPVRGVYAGSLRIADQVRLQNARVSFELRGANGIDVRASAPGRLTVRQDSVPRIGEVTKGLILGRTLPGGAYNVYLPQGVKVWITGQSGPYWRVRLRARESVWIPERAVTLLPSGTPRPGSRVSVVRTTKLREADRVRIFLDERLPFRVEQTLEPPALLVTLYGATSTTHWIRHDALDTGIRGITWTQPEDGVYALRIALNHDQPWGYDPQYDGTDLILDIKRPPRKASLKHLLVCIDPGHGPATGARGPKGTLERDVNLRVALAVKRLLEKDGAGAFLTREGRHGAALDVRPKLAAALGADLLISIHHNALPDGVNPFLNRGSSTYYYHPQSQPLALAIQKHLQKRLKLPNFGVYYDNLAVCRPSQMPAVLVEPAFIMHPEEEMLIRSPKYPKKVAEAIMEGIREFLEAGRR